MIFPISDAQFIEAAYVSDESKLSVSSRSVQSNARGGAYGTTTVQAIIGVPGGMFVRHKNIWNFLPWANVKSARLAGDAPLEIVAAVADPAQRDEPPGAYLRQAPAQPAPDDAADLLGEEKAPAPRRTRARTGQIASVPDPYQPSAPPVRDAMGVLVSIQPKDGPLLACHACGASFVQGSNHVCEKRES